MTKPQIEKRAKPSRRDKSHHPRSIAALAEDVGVCQATVYNEINRGHLEVTKIGARTIVTEEQKRAWLERGRYRVASAPQ